MKLPLARARRDPEQYMLPLINVVFLLLIFFMLAGGLAQTTALDIKAPQSLSNHPAEDRDLRVLLAADGRLAMGDTFLGDDELAARIRGADKPAGLVQLKADARVSAARLVRVLEILRKAGVDKVVLFTAASTQ